MGGGELIFHLLYFQIRKSLKGLVLSRDIPEGIWTRQKSKSFIHENSFLDRTNKKHMYLCTWVCLHIHVLTQASMYVKAVEVSSCPSLGQQYSFTGEMNSLRDVHSFLFIWGHLRSLKDQIKQYKILPYSVEAGQWHIFQYLFLVSSKEVQAKILPIINPTWKALLTFNLPNPCEALVLSHV